MMNMQAGWCILNQTNQQHNMDKETKLILAVFAISIVTIGGAWYYKKVQAEKGSM